MRILLRTVMRWKITFPSSCSKKIVLGDVNNDGAVNIIDVRDIQRNLAELEEFDEYQQLAADANQDGALDISDATAIQMYLADYKLPYPIGQILK